MRRETEVGVEAFVWSIFTVGVECCPWICCPASLGLDLAKPVQTQTISFTVIVKILPTSILKNSPGDNPR